MSAQPTEDDWFLRCLDCGTELDDDNTAPACTEHPTCVDCHDPAWVGCRGCREARNQITTDLADDYAAEAYRDQEHHR